MKTSAPLAKVDSSAMPRVAHHSTGIVAVSSTAANAVLHHQAGASDRSSAGTACHSAYSVYGAFELKY
jgi:hypothetical protein